MEVTVVRVLAWREDCDSDSELGQGLSNFLLYNNSSPKRRGGEVAGGGGYGTGTDGRG